MGRTMADLLSVLHDDLALFPSGYWLLLALLLLVGSVGIAAVLIRNGANEARGAGETAQISLLREEEVRHGETQGGGTGETAA